MFFCFTHNGKCADFLKHDLDDYVGKLPIHTKVLRLQIRGGLVAARLLGAEHARGEVEKKINE